MNFNLNPLSPVKFSQFIIRLLIGILFISLSLGQLTRMTITPSVTLYFHDLIILSIILFWLIYRLLINQPYQWPPLTRPLIVFVTVAGLSLFLSLFRLPFHQFLVAGLYLCRWVVYAFLYFIFKDPKIIHDTIFSRCLLFLITALAVFGLIQYFFYPDLRVLKLFHWDDHYYRLVSTLLDPAFTGLMLVLGLIWLWFSFNQKRFVFFVLFLLYFLSLLLTYSRSSFLALLVVCFYVLLKSKQLKKFILLSLVLLGLLISLPRPGGEGVKLERFYSISQRFENYRQALAVIKRYPLFGTGFNSLRFIKKDSGLLGPDWSVSHSAAGFDNSFLFITATTGLIGLMSFLYLIKRLWTVPIINLSLIAVIIHSLFNNSLFYPWVMIWLWTLLAVYGV